MFNEDDLKLAQFKILGTLDKNILRTFKIIFYECINLVVNVSLEPYVNVLSSF